MSAHPIRRSPGGSAFDTTTGILDKRSTNSVDDDYFRTFADACICRIEFAEVIDSLPYFSDMHAGEWLQAGSLLAVAAALAVSSLQLRNSTRQTALTTRALERSVHDLRANAVMQHSMLLLAEPEVLAWHLEVRGYPRWAINDRRTMYALLRLQIHEQSHLDMIGSNVLDPHVHGAWAAALRRDMGDAFYRRLWPTAREMYAPGFARIVDEIVAMSDEHLSGEPPQARPKP